MLRVRFTVWRVFHAPIVVLAAALLLPAGEAVGQSMSRGAPSSAGQPNAKRPARRGSVSRFHFRQVNGPQVPVLEVRIDGNQSVPTAKIRSYLRTRPDRNFDPELVQNDVRSLMSSGLFRSVKPYPTDVPGGVVVTFEVVERPVIQYVRFIGNRGISDKALAKESDLAKDDALNRYAVDEARRKVEEYYRSKGYTKAQVVVLEGEKPTDQGVTFQIHEGTLQRISRTRFVGNTFVSDARLKTQIKSKPGFFMVFGGKFDPNKIDEDIERLTAYYRGFGYYGARVGREPIVGPSGKWVTVNFVIDEGPRYMVSRVSFLGNNKFASDTLSSQLELKSGEYFNRVKMDRDIAAIRDLYGSQGHYFADIKAEPRFHDEPGGLDLVYNIEEGDVYRVGRIDVVITGDHPHTRHNVILNRLSLSPGDILDVRKIRNSERRLKRSQLFVNEPHRGVTPRIVVRPPELQNRHGTVAGKPSRDGRRSVYRGQSPDPHDRRNASNGACRGRRLRERDLDLTIELFEGTAGNRNKDGVKGRRQ